MLSNAAVIPTIPVTDLARAKKFYGETLGLKLKSAVDDKSYPHAEFECGQGTVLHIYQRGPSKADHTLADFEVTDLDAEMNELRGKGVVFEEYDFPGLKTVSGVATIGSQKGAWFKDPDGNILALTQKM